MTSVGLKSGSLVLRRLTLSAFRSAETKGNKGVVPTIPSYKRVQELQALFLKDDGRMVWQKTATDRAVYSATIVGLVGGASFVVYKAYTMIFPKK